MRGFFSDQPLKAKCEETFPKEITKEFAENPPEQR